MNVGRINVQGVGVIEAGSVDTTADECSSISRVKYLRVKLLASKKQRVVCFFGLTSCFFRKRRGPRGPLVFL